jgi:SAM-dependent methyltransferase
MPPVASDLHFAGSIPELYDALLVPILFAPYAAELAARAAALAPNDVLKVAAGTGALTRALARALPPAAPAHRDGPEHADAQPRRRGRRRPAVTWRRADALALPFPDARFDLVACAFGAMFFPDRPRAFAEARRVLGPGGTLLLATWDRLDENEVEAAVIDRWRRCSRAIRRASSPARRTGTPTPPSSRPTSPPPASRPRASRRALGRCRASSPERAATALCQGEPLRNEMEARGANARKPPGQEGHRRGRLPARVARLRPARQRLLRTAGTRARGARRALRRGARGRAGAVAAHAAARTGAQVRLAARRLLQDRARRRHGRCPPPRHVRAPRGQSRATASAGHPLARYLRPAGHYSRPCYGR